MSGLVISPQIFITTPADALANLNVFLVAFLQLTLALAMFCFWGTKLTG